MGKVKVAVLGATGLVGQKFIQLLENHPWFDVVAVTASERKVGRKYGEAVTWYHEGGIPEYVRELILTRSIPKEIPGDVEYVFSALPRSVAEEVEPLFAKEGFKVISNAGAFRMDDDVPLIIPEINWDHVELISVQRGRRGWSGAIVKNPNCTTAILTLSLKTLIDYFGIRRVIVTTMQALSGAGYRGVPSMAIIDNIIPYIEGEEWKVENEGLKILGKLVRDHVEYANIRISATTTRVPTLYGHLEFVHVELESAPTSVDEVIDVFENFRGLPQKLNLPLAPEKPVIVVESDDRPQPRLDRNAGKGMAVVVGRVSLAKNIGGNWIRYVVLGHNLVRGAAGNTILIAETMFKLGVR